MIACRFALIIALAPAAAFAQPPPPVPSPAKPGPTVIVQDNKGAETKGKLLRLDVREAVLLIDGQERRFDLANVRRIEKRGDSLKNGMIAGAAVGLLSGLFGGQLLCDAGDKVCKDDIPNPLAVAVVWAGIGAGTDALIQRRTTLYQSPITTNVARTGQSQHATIAIRLRW